MTLAELDHQDDRRLNAFTVIQQQEQMRMLLKLPWDAVIHAARHTALTNLGMTGADLFTVQRAAGHASITTTRKYVHPTPEAMMEAFKKKAQGERRDRRKAGRKQSANVVKMPPVAERQSAVAGLRG